MSQYIINSFRGGISDEATKGIAGSFKYGYDLDIHKRRDSLSCGFQMMTITDSRYTTAAGLVKHVICGADGSSYCFTDTGAVISIAGSQTDPVQNYHYVDTNGAIKGAAEWQLDTGQNYLMWCTNTSVARKLFPGADANVWTDATIDYQTLLTASDYHPMKNACGSMMIGNENFISSLSYAGVFTYGAMNLRPGNQVRCLEERDDYLIIGTERKDNSEEGHIWNWITSATNWIQKKKIPVKGVNAIIDVERLLLQGGTNGEIFYSDFVNSAPLNAVPSGGQVNSGGVSVENDLAVFGFYGSTTSSGIYSYGRRRINRPTAFNFEHRMAATIGGSTVTEIGAVWNNNGTLYASWKAAESNGDYSYGVDMISNSTRATARYEGLEFAAGQPHLHKQFESAKVTMEPLPVGTGTASSGPLSPGTMADDATVGTVAWASPDSAKVSDDNDAGPGAIGNGVASHYLKATNFGFSIPSGATITGVLAEVEGKTVIGSIVENSVKLVKGGTISGNDKSTGASPAGADAYVSYGGSSDLWGVSLTPDDINSSGFGVAYSTIGAAPAGGISTVDHIRITVYYTTACSISLPYRENRNTDWRYATVGGGDSTTYSITDSTEAEFVINARSRVIEIGLELNPSGTATPEVSQIITYIGDKPTEHK